MPPELIERAPRSAGAGPRPAACSRAERRPAAAAQATNLRYDTIFDLGAASTTGWRGCEAARAGRARHRDRLARRDARATSSASRFSVEAGRGGLHPAGATTTPARRSSCRATRCWRALKPWLENAAQAEARPAHQVRPPCVRQPRHRGARLRARHACCKATCSKRTSRTAWRAWPSATSAAPASTTKTSCGKGAHQIPFAQVDDRASAAEYSVRGLRP